MASFIKGLELDKEDLRGKMVVIKEEDGGEANFCLSGMVWHCLSDPQSGFLLLASSRSFNHYYHVQMKIGFNLTTHKDRALIVELRNAISSESEPMLTDIDKCSDESIHSLFLGIKSKLEELKTRYSRVYFFMDSVNSLLFLGYSSSQIKRFLHKVRTLIDQAVTVVLLSQSFPEDDEERDVSQFLWVVADLRLSVASLSSGASEAVSGTITLSKRNFNQVTSWTEPKLYHYKLMERNVKIFLPGNI